MPHLSVRPEKNAPAKRYEVKGVTVVGRDKSCEIMIDDKKASRQHARVFLTGNQFFVEDLASRNGTIVNGGKLQGRVPIHGGDEIRIGDHYLLFEDERPEAPRPARRPSSALAEAHAAVSGSLGSFFSTIVSLLVFGATMYASKLFFVMLLKND